MEVAVKEYREMHALILKQMLEVESEPKLVDFPVGMKPLLEEFINVIC